MNVDHAGNLVVEPKEFTLDQNIVKENRYREGSQQVNE